MSFLQKVFSVGALVKAISEGFESLARELSGVQGAVRDTGSLLQDGTERLAEELLARVIELESAVDLLPSKWEEIEHKARRTEERTRASVRRIKNRYEANGIFDDELEGVSHDVGLSDAGPSETGGVSTMPEGLGHPRNGSGPETTEESWVQATLKQKYGHTLPLWPE